MIPKELPTKEAVRPIVPELDPFGDHAIAAPVRRAGNVLALEAARHFVEATFKRLTAVEGPRLVGSPCAEPGVAAAAREIGVCLLVAHALDRPFDTHLPSQRLPMKKERGSRIFGDLATLGAFVVGVEDEAVGPMALQEHHSDRRLTIRAGRRERHRFGVVDLRRTRFAEPLVEQGHRIVHLAEALRLGLGRTATHLVTS